MVAVVQDQLLCHVIQMENVIVKLMLMEPNVHSVNQDTLDFPIAIMVNYLWLLLRDVKYTLISKMFLGNDPGCCSRLTLKRSNANGNIIQSKIFTLTTSYMNDNPQWIETNSNSYRRIWFNTVEGKWVYGFYSQSNQVIYHKALVDAICPDIIGNMWTNYNNQYFISSIECT